MQPIATPQPSVPGLLTRHPLDPEPVRDSKAGAVLALGVMALLTGFLLGGVIPATLALVLARESRREIRASGGFLTGSGATRAGVVFAWSGLALAAAGVVVAVIVALVHMAAAGGARDYPANVN